MEREPPPSERPAPEQPTPAPDLAEITAKDLELYRRMGHKSPKWDELVIAGFQSFDAGSTATAAILIGRAHELGCRDPLALFRLAIYRESRGEHTEAARLFEETGRGLPKRYPGHPLITALPRHIGRALYKADEYQRALPFLERALAVEPGDFMLLFMASQILRMQGRLEEARAGFERALGSALPAGITPDPETTVLRELVAITFQLKDLEACEGYLERLAQRAPDDPALRDFSRQIFRIRQRERELEIIKSLIE